MPGLGTLINIAGGSIGYFFGGLLNILGGVHPDLLRGSKPDFRAKDPRGQLPASLGFRCGLCFYSRFLAN